MRRLLTLLCILHVLSVGAFETEECPGDCSCHMDGLLMLVDCSGLEMSELPEFPDNHVRVDCMSHMPL